ncbi:hypothetical protein RND71_003427 [Anisodus tanguticus]|uniref:Uncharacterized protein n=1 Tax=Anisodus tanguticus TaxID=243964 RepID=A0AAE1SWM6_9SOLA|nr:hypothetical protein RND71_003427 [Anisodus tanguticus]
MDRLIKEFADHSPLSKNMSDSEALVRNRSFTEMKIFWERWVKASKEDECWVDPFQNQETDPRD